MVMRTITTDNERLRIFSWFNPPYIYTILYNYYIDTPSRSVVFPTMICLALAAAAIVSAINIIHSANAGSTSQQTTDKSKRVQIL
jgi:hypothetical protein